ncbi:MULTISPECIES: DUF86 domain-containing protein [Heyndrickxia]|jgi:uncharacterized protein YutE (UPF0331/DUF86 family)|uniref:Uncharacterized protein n=2 Tax=Heyndrickxia coagulans TaxID=1398 RepID=A0A150KEG3_HEYCO|nr:DUF86 domain-containing protein [Heyndrickxia coagulans]AJH79564.1 hypothetical protein BF29_1289 [Heyndrickxia coagulans DSM 1 = ATCC 7050]KYC67539.1 hypothetical protein B4099_2417 [Heyndrickxia coagulans]MBF8416825.1 DUF86 domain-containing protein [Heyndrickxia coagulans]MCR2846963.1 DUF86 domain-containing protein [Heyndrickxia coagulans]MDR4224626.1 DUF86 domain-containing protein [Heyndrickxia coagulans DSM 1 = ATCC 7050]
MYFVDREKINGILSFMEKRLALFQAQPAWQTEIEKAALERIAETVIESVLDAGNAIIDGFIMRDPGSYEDIIDILEDENVVSAESAKQLTAVIALRKQLVREYTDPDYATFQEVLAANFKALERFPKDVRTYLANELGPVNAFKGE